MMGRSFFMERMRINVEIFCERIGDSLGSLKKPLMFLAAFALAMTLRTARKEIQKMKAGGLFAGVRDVSLKPFGNPVGGYSSTSGLSSIRSTYSTPGGSYSPGGSYTPGGSSTYSSLGGSSTSSYSSTSSLGSSSYTPGGTSSLSSYSSSASSRPLADLVDQHGDKLQIIQDHEFYDYGGIIDFYGKVLTVQANDAPAVVEKILKDEPGQNRVMVIHGNGNKRSAIFGKNAAKLAKDNGWKGVVVYGAIQNAKEVGQTPIGVKALGTFPKKGTSLQGNKGVQLNVSGRTVSNDMWVYADKDGIAFSATELTTNGASSTGATPIGSTTSPGSTTPIGQPGHPGSTTTTSSLGQPGHPGSTTTTSSLGQPGQPGSTTTTSSLGQPGSTSTSTYSSTTSSGMPGTTSTTPGSYPGTSTTSTYPATTSIASSMGGGTSTYNSASPYSSTSQLGTPGLGGYNTGQYSSGGYQKISGSKRENKPSFAIQVSLISIAIIIFEYFLP